jgi:hypothetical protein
MPQALKRWRGKELRIARILVSPPRDAEGNMARRLQKTGHANQT